MTTTALQLITRDYNGLTFVFREDGYFNMTKAAARFEKEVYEFLRLPGTKEYIEAIKEVIRDFPGSVVETKKGYHTHPTVGTWAHPKLAVFFACWLDVKFAVWCDMVIHDILASRAELTITKPEESAVLKVEQPNAMLAMVRGLLEAAEQSERRLADLAASQAQVVEVAAQAVAKVETLEKDVKFSHNMLTFDEFCGSYGIQRRKEGRRSLSSVVAQKMQGKPSRNTMLVPLTEE